MTTNDGVADTTDPLDLVVTAARAADEMPGADVVVLDVGSILAITGWFVVCEGSNPRHVKTLVGAIEEAVYERHGVKPLRIEGLAARRWVLLDYGDFVVHVFGPDARSYYDLERLWSDVPRVEWAAVDV